MQSPGFYDVSDEILLRQASGLLPRVGDVGRHARLCAAHRTRAGISIRQLGGHQVRSRRQRAYVSQPRPASVQIVSATDLLQQPAQHRRGPRDATLEPVLPEHSWLRLAQHRGRRQLGAGGEPSPESCAIADPDRANASNRWAFGVRSVKGDLRAGSADHRFVATVFSLARFRSVEAAVKRHTLLIRRGAVLTFDSLSDGYRHDVYVAYVLLLERRGQLGDGSRLGGLRAPRHSRKFP